MSFSILSNLRTAFRKKPGSTDRYLRMSSSEQHLLLILVMHAKPDGSNIRVSNLEVSAFSGLSSNTVKKFRKKLILDGWLVGGKNNGRSRIYTFNVDKLKELLEDKFSSSEKSEEPKKSKVTQQKAQKSPSRKRKIHPLTLLIKAYVNKPLMGNGFSKQKEEEHPGKQPEEKASKTFEQGPPKNSPLDLSAEERDNYDLVKMLRSMDVFDGQIRKILPEYGPEKIRGAIAVTKEAWLAGKIKTTRGAYMMHYLKNGSRY